MPSRSYFLSKTPSLDEGFAGGVLSHVFGVLGNGNGTGFAAQFLSHQLCNLLAVENGVASHVELEAFGIRTVFLLVVEVRDADDNALRCNAAIVS